MFLPIASLYSILLHYTPIKYTYSKITSTLTILVSFTGSSCRTFYVLVTTICFVSAFEMKLTLFTSAVVVLVYNIFCVIREACNLRQQKWHYIVDPWNLVSWMLYISSTITVYPTILGRSDDIQVFRACCDRFHILCGNKVSLFLFSVRPDIQVATGKVY